MRLPSGRASFRTPRGTTGVGTRWLALGGLAVLAAVLAALVAGPDRIDERESVQAPERTSH